MKLSATSWWFLIALLASAWGPSAVGAQTLGCRTDLGPRGPNESFPASGASGVALDAPLRISYSQGYLADFDSTTVAELLEVFLCVDEACIDRLEVTGELSIIDDELFFLPSASWNAFARYRGTALGTDRNLPFTFVAGSTVDSGPPTFSGSLSVNAEPTQDPCYKEGDPGEPGQGYRVEVSFAPATDDGSPGDIEYQLFLTRGPDVDAPRRVARTRNFGATQRVSLAFYIDEASANDTYCVDLITLDGVGNITKSDAPECFNATLGRDFVGCSIQKDPQNSSLVWYFLIAVALPLARAKHRRGRAKP